MHEFLAGLLVGSLEILGNPTGLVRSIGNGVADMFSMPYRGLARGPGEFLYGVRRGTGSLLWHLSTGFVIQLQPIFSAVCRINFYIIALPHIPLFSSVKYSEFLPHYFINMASI